jgi:hypothetical protein
MVTFRLDHQSISIDLPDATKKELDFTESSFSASPTRCLPSPTEVQAVSSEPLNVSKANPVRFEHLDLIFKFGSHVTTLEALNLWVVKRICKDKVPVPEVFGWRIDDNGHVFIYMELIKGPTLLESWNSLDCWRGGPFLVSWEGSSSPSVN